MTPPADPTPADARALATEAIRLREAATPGPWTIPDGPLTPSKGDEGCFVLYGGAHGWGTKGLGEFGFFDNDPCEVGRIDAKANAALSAHAGTHYATLARALLAALDERDEMESAWELATQDLAKVAEDRDALLADLPLAIEAARDGYGHRCDACLKCAAIARLEARIK